MIALVAPTVVVTIGEIAPEHAPELSVHVPAQLCNEIVSVPVDETTCEIPNETNARALILFTLKYCCQHPLALILVLLLIIAVVVFEITIFLVTVVLIETILEPAGIPAGPVTIIPTTKPVVAPKLICVEPDAVDPLVVDVAVQPAVKVGKA